ncbi:MAG: tRNA (adenosine(37)-N6)-dimethylallyltransferase MiaA, partial [Muribaculaceae bacterium]|nr:tRNA (adenosine(37)-N6)-dimethylallyltransferase MiaA [Muribaculaceae bacterium]
MKTVLAIVGPTASGKTSRAVDVARALGGEIISGDSRQVYRGMDIGTGKDLCEYGEVPYHLVDIEEAGRKYNLFEYLRDAAAAVESVQARGKAAVICGGTGMYVESLLAGKRLPEVPCNPELRRRLEGKTLEELASVLAGMKQLHNVTDLDTCKRAVRAIEIQTYYREHPECAGMIVGTSPMKSVVVGLDIPREERRRRITARLDARLEEGMVDEVRRLIDGGVSPEDLIYYG